MAPGKQRLFVAVEVPETVRAAVAEATRPLRRSAPDLRWVAPDRQHLTLAFLGWLTDDAREQVEAVLADVAGAHAPFRLGLAGTAGTFRGGVLWAGVIASDDLAALVDGLRRRLTGVPEVAVDDRPFAAHLTLARAGRGQRISRAVRDAYSGPAAAWTVDRIALMRSHVGGAGARYEVRGVWPLATR